MVWTTQTDILTLGLQTQAHADSLHTSTHENQP